MSNDVTNRTLATILMVAIVVSLGSTLLSLNKSGSLASITGRAQSDTGSAQVSVQESISIILLSPNDTINFGTGFVNGSIAACASTDWTTGGANLTTVGLGYNTNNCFTSSGGYAPAALGANYHQRHFQLENDGTVNASVSINGPAAGTLFGTPADARGKEFMWKAQAYTTTNGFRGTEQNACSSGGALVTAWTNFSRNSTVCDDLQWQNTNDMLRVDVKIRFPTSQVRGLYNTNAITFYAVKA